ncbi:unnamed protein product, partial [Musa hybrid cultivar]
SRHPTTKWAQRSDKVYITIELPDAKDVKLTLEPEGRFYFSATSGTANIRYELDLELFDRVNVDESKAAVGLRTICYLVKKAEKKWWSRLLKQAGKPPVYLKVDWDKWIDEDDEKENKFGGMDFDDMDFSKLDVGGADDEPDDDDDLADTADRDGDDDVRSEASSDLFEIESLSMTSHPFISHGGTESAPSEASIEWSVTVNIKPLATMAGRRNNNGKRSYSQSDYSDNGGSKRRNPGEERDTYAPGPEDTVFRYLCPGRKIGSIIGRGGEIVKQLRSDTQAKIRIGETIPGCEERVITIFSTRRETNTLEDIGDIVCPAQDALFKVHERLVTDEAVDEDIDGDNPQVTVRLLVPSDQIGCIIGKGGQIIQGIRSDTGAQVRILKNEHLPACAISSDELLQVCWIICSFFNFPVKMKHLIQSHGIIFLLFFDEVTLTVLQLEWNQIGGEASVVKKALLQVSSRLHDNPSRSQHLLSSGTPQMLPVGGQFGVPGTTAPVIGIGQLISSYGGYKGDAAVDWPSFYPTPRDETAGKEFSLRLLCPSANIGGVIGKGGVIIKQIRQESGASVKVDSSSVEDDCIITITAKEVGDLLVLVGDGFMLLYACLVYFFEDPISSTIDAAVRLQPRCSEKTERDSGEPSYTTRLLVSTSRIGCLIGKGGSIISEMRKSTQANIRILSKENVPKVASEDDEMVQISGDIDTARNALVQVTTRLKANFFERENALSSVPASIPFHPLPNDASEGSRYGSRDAKAHGRGFSYSGGYGSSSDLVTSDTYGSYGGSQGGGSSYGAYGGYSSRHGSSG